MIISWLRDGLGDQMFRYAAGRRLALHLGVRIVPFQAPQAVHGGLFG